MFLDGDEWPATLRGIRTALAVHGHPVFESRRPERRVWEDWAVVTGPVVRDVPGVREVEQRTEVTQVVLPYVPFRQSCFARKDTLISSRSTLPSRSRAEIEDSVASAAITILEARDASDRPQQENVFIARRLP